MRFVNNFDSFVFYFCLQFDPRVGQSNGSFAVCNGSASRSCTRNGGTSMIWLSLCLLYWLNRTLGIWRTSIELVSVCCFAVHLLYWGHFRHTRRRTYPDKSCNGPSILLNRRIVCFFRQCNIENLHTCPLFFRCLQGVLRYSNSKAEAKNTVALYFHTTQQLCTWQDQLKFVFYFLTFTKSAK